MELSAQNAVFGTITWVPGIAYVAIPTGKVMKFDVVWKVVTLYNAKYCIADG